MRFMLKTVDTALSVLRMFTRDKPVWGGRELAKELDMNHTKIYRILETLEKNGFVLKDSVTKKYSLGYSILELGMTMYEGTNIKEVIYPILEGLSNKAGESIFLTALDKDEAITLEVVQPENKVKYSVSVGSRAPLYVGASYRAILAYLPDEQIATILGTDTLKKYTSNTMVEPESIKQELSNIRERGWAISKGEYTEDVIAIAVPLFEAGQIIGSITISGPHYRITEKDILSFLPSLKEASNELTDVIEKYQLKL